MIHVSRKTNFPDEFPLRKIRQIAELVFDLRNCSGDATIIFTNNTEIQSLNNNYRKNNSVTDVLSFPSNEIDPEFGTSYLGDVVISIEKAYSQADEANKLRNEELIMLIVHGCLHLTGLDHETANQKEEMKSYQERILKKLEVKTFAWPETEIE